MKVLVADPAELEVKPDAAKASEGVMAQPHSASILESIQVGESTLTPVMEGLFQFRPTSHWGINE